MTYVEIISAWIESIIESETGEPWEHLDKSGLKVIEVLGGKRIRLDLGEMVMFMGHRRHTAENVPVKVSEEGLLIAFPARPLYIYIPEAVHHLQEHSGKKFAVDLRYNVFIRDEYYQIFLRDGVETILSPMDYVHRGFEVSVKNADEAKFRMLDRNPVN